MSRLFAILLLLLASTSRAEEPSRWRVEDGWLLRSQDGGASYDRFFAIALWGAPGWHGSADGDPAVQARLAEALAHFNVIHTRAMDLPDVDRYIDDARRDAVFMVGLSAFSWKLKDPARGGGYSADLPLSFEGRAGRPDYADIQTIRGDLATRRALADYLAGVARGAEARIDATWSDGHGLDAIWNLADEPDINYEGWLLPPELIESCRRAVDGLDPDLAPTFVGLSAVTGSRLCFENLLTDGGRHPLPDSLPRNAEELPAHFPRDSLSTWAGDPGNYDSYLFMADGLPVMRRDARRGRLRRRPWPQLRERMTETVRMNAAAYREGGAIFGLNRYPAFELYPELAGECVDLFRTACGTDAPVWLFFDGLGREDQNYWANLRCQVFTSIVHGATGVQFWQPGDMTENPSEFWWGRLRGLADELQRLLPVLTLDTEDRGVTDPGAHYATFIDRQGRRHLIATNPDPQEPCELVMPGVYSGSLAPLGVLVHSLF